MGVNLVRILSDKKIVSLDVDGTLYDMKKFKKEFRLMIFRKLFLFQGEYKLADLLRILIFHYCARNVRKNPSLTNFTKLHKASCAAIAGLQSWYGQCLRTIGPRYGLISFMSRLRDQGILIVALTDYCCDYKLQALRISEYFDSHVVGEKLRSLKPSPLQLACLINRYDVKSPNVLHIGDNRNRDGLCAEKNSVDFLILSEDFTDFTDLLIKMKDVKNHE